MAPGDTHGRGCGTQPQLLAPAPTLVPRQRRHSTDSGPAGSALTGARVVHSSRQLHHPSEPAAGCAQWFIVLIIVQTRGRGCLDIRRLLEEPFPSLLCLVFHQEAASCGAGHSQCRPQPEGQEGGRKQHPPPPGNTGGCWSRPQLAAKPSTSPSPGKHVK